MSRTTWSPFQSAEVTEICAHLTEYEQSELRESARRYGAESGERFGKFLALVGFHMIGAGMALTWHWTRWLAWLVILGGSCVVLTIIGILIMRKPMEAQRRRMRELLCSTQWARAQGFTPETLPLHRWPWRRRVTWSGAHRDRVQTPPK